MLEKKYLVKEVYYTLQGEGHHAGRPAVFCRFSGCNLWSGREEDRNEAVCTFCDTDFRGTDGPGGGRFDARGLAAAIRALWPASGEGKPYVVFTGGEPLLQLDEPLIEEVHAEGFEIGVETNGTIPAPAGIDWLCVSPKAGSDWVQRSGDELKLVFPQPGLLPDDVPELQFAHCYLQPMDGRYVERNTADAIKWCLEHPRWHLSLQTHKFIGIP